MIDFIPKKAVQLKNFLFDTKILNQIKVPVPVISIGNLTMGGTGKTPITAFLLKNLIENGKRPGVILRSYRAHAKDPHKVTGNNPEYSGDEASQLALLFPYVPVWAGPRKWQTAQSICQQENIDVLLVDDGFQHRKLFRDIDIVLVDATEAMKNYKLFPFGRGREPFASLRRAHHVFITKANLVEPAVLRALEAELKTYIDANKISIWQSHLLLENPMGLKILALCGIAKHDQFIQLLAELLKKKPTEIEKMVFSDHHPYSTQDIQDILYYVTTSKCDSVVTTQKDYVKLKKIWNLQIPLRVANLEMEPVNGEKVFKTVLNEIN